MSAQKTAVSAGQHRRPGLPWAALVVLLAAGSVVVVASSAQWSAVLRTATPLLAAVLLVISARHGGPLGRARWLMASALLVGAATGTGFAVAEAAGWTSALPGSAVDWLGVTYVPLAIAAIVALPRARGAALTHLANALVCFGSLWYLAQALVLEPLGVAQGLSATEQVLRLAYVLVTCGVLATLLTILPLVRGVSRWVLVPLSVGITSMLVADAGYAISVWHGDQWDHTGWEAVLGQVAFACYVLVGLTPARCGTVPVGPSTTWTRFTETAVPYLPLVVGLSVVVGRAASGLGVPVAHVPPFAVVAFALILRHTSATLEHNVLTGELRRGKEDAEQRARLDPLTGLVNRTCLVDHLAQALADRSRYPVAVALVDINDFKDVNDSHGHETGDRLLVECARRLLGCVPVGGTVARLGSDEFVLIQPAARDGGRGLGEQVRAAFSEPVTVGSRQFQVRPSTGVVVDEAWTPDRSPRQDAEMLLAHADVAMYQAKEDKSVVAAPLVVLTGPERLRAARLIRLREEITVPELDQFRVEYQPMVSLDTGRVEAVEALLRWCHPELGEVSPAHFIPLAEQVGSVGLLGDMVLDAALRALVDLDEATGSRHVVMSVNLSPAQLAEPDLPQRLRILLDRHGVPAPRLALEITEGALVRDVNAAVAMVDRLRALGVGIAVDDFGTGYSSLGYLRRFAVDELKVDREFVRVLPQDTRTAALLHSVVDMAAALGCRTVAEGIETPQQRQVLADLGFDLGQGYLFSRPVPLPDLVELLRPQSSSAVLAGG